jgi:hypothetical protein
MKRANLVIVLSLVLACGCHKQDAAKQEPAKQEPTQQEAAQTKADQPAAATAESPKWDRKGDFIIAFGGSALAPTRRNPQVAYGLDSSVERFFVHVPEDYTGETQYGLIVFTDADSDSRQLPDGWQAVLDHRKFLYIAAQGAGNDQYSNRRLGLAVLGALEMMKHYRIDPSRVYAAGFSGGARMAGMLGFYQADVFHGTIQNCGADFYRPVPTQAATSAPDTAGNPYGLFDATADEIAGARSVRFALITGSRDFRHGNILDIFNGGFAAEGFKAKLFDVPGMPHDTADAQTLSAALDFIEQTQ